MKTIIMLLAILLLPLTALKAEEDHDHEHHHHDMKPAHGGEILEVGEHVAYIELVHDKKLGKITLYITDAHGKTLAISDAPRLNLIYRVDKEDKKKQLITKAKAATDDGSASEFEVQDDVLKSEEFEGLISIKINGKSYRVELNHHDHNHEGHDHGKHDGHNH
jgi:hypothetical protein